MAIDHHRPDNVNAAAIPSVEQLFLLSARPGNKETFLYSAANLFAFSDDPLGNQRITHGLAGQGIRGLFSGTTYTSAIGSASGHSGGKTEEEKEEARRNDAFFVAQVTQIAQATQETNNDAESSFWFWHKPYTKEEFKAEEKRVAARVTEQEKIVTKLKAKVETATIHAEEKRKELESTVKKQVTTTLIKRGKTPEEAEAEAAKVAPKYSGLVEKRIEAEVLRDHIVEKRDAAVAKHTELTTTNLPTLTEEQKATLTTRAQAVGTALNVMDGFRGRWDKAFDDLWDDYFKGFWKKSDTPPKILTIDPPADLLKELGLKGDIGKLVLYKQTNDYDGKKGKYFLVRYDEDGRISVGSGSLYYLSEDDITALKLSEDDLERALDVEFNGKIVGRSDKDRENLYSLARQYERAQESFAQTRAQLNLAPETQLMTDQAWELARQIDYYNTGIARLETIMAGLDTEIADMEEKYGIDAEAKSDFVKAVKARESAKIALIEGQQKLAGFRAAQKMWSNDDFRTQLNTAIEHAKAGDSAALSEGQLKAIIASHLDETANDAVITVALEDIKNSLATRGITVKPGGSEFKPAPSVPAGPVRKTEEVSTLGGTFADAGAGRSGGEKQEEAPKKTGTAQAFDDAGAGQKPEPLQETRYADASHDIDTGIAP